MTHVLPFICFLNYSHLSDGYNYTYFTAPSLNIICFLPEM